MVKGYVKTLGNWTSLSRELLNTHLRIANRLSKSDWSLINQLTLIKAKHVGEDSKARQLKKFTRLLKKQHPTTNTIKETVINLSNRKLDDTVYSLLQKGLNFAVTPCSTRIEDILAGVEKAALSLPVEMAEEARQETVRITKKSSWPRDNLRTTERAALKTLIDNVNLTILPADKGNSTMVLNTSDYKRRFLPSWKTQHTEH